MFTRSVFTVMLALALAGIGCGASPARPSPPPVELPDVTCPASVSTKSADGQPVSVPYEPATYVGGFIPVTVVCSPESGSLFPTGSTTVTCTATDAGQRTDACTFAVTVVAPPLITKTRFVSFGDSITEGKVAFGAFTLIARPQSSYPTGLRDLLTKRYATQSIVFTNAGRGGEKAAEWSDNIGHSGRARLPGVLNAEQPEVLLLMEGVNDLNYAGEDAINDVVAALRSMIREAQGRGVRVFLGTLLPQRQGGSRSYSYGLIPETNNQIRALAAAEGADLVDLYEGFGGQAGDLIGDDGLHPNDAGYEKIAEIFFAALQAKLEVPQN